MTKASFRQADIARMVAGALKGGLPVGSFEVRVDKGLLRLLPASPPSGLDALEDVTNEWDVVLHGRA